MIWGEIPTARNMVGNGYVKDGKCAFYKGIENTNHLLDCESLNTIEARSMASGVTKGKLAKPNVDPNILYRIMERLKRKTPRVDEERNLRMKRYCTGPMKEKTALYGII